MHLLFALALACSKGAPAQEDPVQEDPELTEPAPVALSVQRACHPWPAEPFTTDHFLEIKALVEREDQAPDLTIRTTEGLGRTLSSLWSQRPLLIISGSTTCPVFRRHVEAIQDIARDYEGRADLIVVHGPQAHPAQDPSPYRGTPWPLKYSRVDLARTWEERALQGGEVAKRAGLEVYVDEMDTPFGCTYGTVPNGAFLIGQDGVIETVHDWFDPVTMRGSLDALLSE
jgi:hypothetical protein